MNITTIILCPLIIAWLAEATRKAFEDMRQNLDDNIQRQIALNKPPLKEAEFHQFYNTALVFYLQRRIFSAVCSIFGCLVLCFFACIHIHPIVFLFP